MSDRSYLRTKAPIQGSNDFAPANQVQSRPFVAQTKALGDSQQANQFDAGLMQNLGLQPKLTVGQPGDKYEQEADNVANQVVEQINSPQAQQKTVQREAMPEEEEKLQQKPLADSIQREAMPEEEEELQMKPLAESIQRQEMPEEEELQQKPLADTVQREAMPEEEEDLQMKPDVQRQAVGGDASAQVEAEISGARGQGQPLSDDVRGSMEGAFGTDFGGVRVHTDEQSNQLNTSLQSRAFTTGQDIFFKKGEFDPGSQDGQELLAHELTHVVQQNGRNNI
ncbi:MAG: DUF4157 domain-containing protein [Cyanobacteria bacterium P01_F01_bin.53]